MRFVLLLLLLALPTAGFASTDEELRRARDHFEYGEFERARQIAETLLEQNVLAQDEQLIDANRIAGLSWFYSSDPEKEAKAERYFLQLLSIEPDYKLDPFFTPPAAIQFFERVRTEHEAQLAPIRQQRRRAKEARRAEEQARRRFLAEQQREREAADMPVRLVEKRHQALIFLPLGVGQFQNGDTRAGWTLATVQAVAGVTSIASYVAIEQMREGGGFSPGRMGTVRTLDTVKWASAALFYAAWAYGITDAWLKFEPEVVREVPASSLQPAPELRIAPQVAPTRGGGTLGLTMEF